MVTPYYTDNAVTCSFKGRIRNVHLARVERDAFSGDMTHIVSGDCSVYGGLLALLAILKCGRHEVFLTARTERISKSLVLMQEADFAPTGRLRAYYFYGQNWDLHIQRCYVFANDCSNRIRRMVHDVVTNWPCKPYARTIFHIVDMLESLEYSGPMPSTNENNILPDEMGVRLLVQSLYRTVDKSSISIPPKCSRGFYHKKTRRDIAFRDLPHLEMAVGRLRQDVLNFSEGGQRDSCEV